MLSLRISIVAALLSTCAAAAPAPVERRWFGSHWWNQHSSYIEFARRFPGPETNAPSCDLSNAVMPTAPTPLPAPAAGLSLAHVAIGRGTQNYTCDLTNATAIPVAIGALATLFNVSCLAADMPDLLTKLPSIALDLPVPSTKDASSPLNTDMSGHHYFLDPKTPFFNLDTSLHQYGTGAFKKMNVSNAPTDAMVGQNNQGAGAVQWLKLDAKSSDGQVFQEVYRVNTVGGNPPASCQGQQASFEVAYAAEYWLYAL